MSKVYVIIYNGLDDERSIRHVFSTYDAADLWIARSKEGWHSEIHHYSIDEVDYD